MSEPIERAIDLLDDAIIELERLFYVLVQPEPPGALADNYNALIAVRNDLGEWLTTLLASEKGGAAG